MRLDRILSLYAVEPLRRVLAKRNDGHQIPILMYHSITNDPEAGVHPYFKVNTPPAVFKEHMRLLQENGYKTTNLDHIVAQSKNPGKKHDDKRSGKLVVITFDDGFHNLYTHAFPIMKQAGFTGAMYLPTGFIGRGKRKKFKTTECLTWEEVRELRSEGFEFGSHTVNHPKLVNLERTEIERELNDSKAHLEDQLQCDIAHFAHPYSFPSEHKGYVSTFKRLAAEAGYKTCATTEIGRWNPHRSDLLRLKRLPINSDDDHALFSGKLNGAYDWLAKPQFLFRLKRFTRSNRS